MKPLERATTAPTETSVLEERRRSSRRPNIVEATIASPTATRPDDFLPVTAVNISRHGVAFTLGQPVAEYSYYQMKLSIGGQDILSEVRIISCRKTDQGQFEIGAEFC